MRSYLSCSERDTLQSRYNHPRSIQLKEDYMWKESFPVPYVVHKRTSILITHTSNSRFMMVKMHFKRSWNFSPSFQHHTHMIYPGTEYLKVFLSISAHYQGWKSLSVPCNFKKRTFLLPLWKVPQDSCFFRKLRIWESQTEMFNTKILQPHKCNNAPKSKFITGHFLWDLALVEVNSILEWKWKVFLLKGQSGVNTFPFVHVNSCN